MFVVSIIQNSKTLMLNNINIVKQNITKSNPHCLNTPLKQANQIVQSKPNYLMNLNTIFPLNALKLNWRSIFLEHMC